MQDKVIIATFTYVHELQVLRSILESEGIECFTIDENTVQTDPLVTYALGGVKLAVNRFQLREALIVMEKYKYRKEGLDETEIDGEYLELKFLSNEQKKDINYAKSFLLPTIIITLIFVILSLILALTIVRKQTLNEEIRINFRNLSQKNLPLCGFRY